MRIRSIDISGKRFGRLVAVDRAPRGDRKSRRAMWNCECDCGAICVVGADQLKSGHTMSCGCLKIEVTKKMHTKHGAASGYGVTPEYQAWLNMRARCGGGQPASWKNYGGRGISVCREWEGDFEAFFAHVGPRPAPGYELDRIDNNGDYEPGNVRWVTKEENNKNRRTRAQVEADDRVS